MRALEALCRRLVPLYAMALDLPADFFDVCFAVPHMILRMSRYPVIDGEDETVASLVPIAGPTSGFCRRRIGCATFHARCAMQSRSSATPITTR
jgi:hypothetical protein